MVTCYGSVSWNSRVKEGELWTYVLDVLSALGALEIRESKRRGAIVSRMTHKRHTQVNGTVIKK